MPPHRLSLREEYRQRQNVRINASPNLAEAFRELKGLAVDLAFYDSSGLRKASEIKYTVNLNNAKSVFSFMCPKAQCVGGDYDLTENLARAVAARLPTASGEISCRGWQSKTTIDSARCCNVLRYKLTLEY